LSIARLITVRRPIWLLDEPTSALDASGQTLFAAVMRDHLARGGIVIAATHAPLGVEAKQLRIGGET
jgi:heme exporter protein A